MKDIKKYVNEAMTMNTIDIGITGIDVKVVFMLHPYKQSCYIKRKVVGFCSKIYIIGEQQKDQNLPLVKFNCGSRLIFTWLHRKILKSCRLFGLGIRIYSKSKIWEDLQIFLIRKRAPKYF